MNDTLWRPAEVPGAIHTDLLRNNVIADPFLADNETNLQWIEREDWQYKLVFSCPEIFIQNTLTVLRFRGLDTYATVYLNDSLILQANNMFRSWHIPVSGLLKRDQNTLLVQFHSAVKKGEEYLLKSSFVLPGDAGGKTYLRKSAYHFGWDWGPRLVTCGIWQPVEVFIPETSPSAERLLPPSEKPALVQQIDSAGRSFYFEINGQKVFMMGANVIPPEYFLSQADEEDYTRLVDLAAECGMNMLRVWGGGAYFPDTFYSYCESKGIYIWQDFMFANTMPPADDEFLQNIIAEATEQILRLRKFKCIALWCGNNEIDEAWHNWGWQNENSPENNEKIWNHYITIFDSILPQLVNRYDTGRAYISSSPAFGWGRKESLTHGDSHYWGVWWGGKPYRSYEEHVGRFMSEYGFQSLPEAKSLARFIPEQHLLIPDSDSSANQILKAHQKHPRGFSLINDQLKQNYPLPESFAHYCYVTQLLQRDAMTAAIKAHRLSQPYCMGTLYWQLNDCWPVISWSSVDYYGKKKAFHYALKRELYRSTISDARIHQDSVHVCLLTDLAENSPATLQLQWFETTTGQLLYSAEEKIELLSQKKICLSVPANVPGEVIASGKLMGRLTVSDEKKNLLTESTLLPHKPLNISWAHPDYQWKLKKLPASKNHSFRYRLLLECNVPTKDIYLDSPDVESWSDNYFDCFPGVTKEIVIHSALRLKKNFSPHMISLNELE